MGANDFNAAGLTLQGLDPNSARAPAICQLERVITHDHAGTADLEGNLPARKRARRSKMVCRLKHQSGGVRAVRNKLRVIRAQQQLIRGGNVSEWMTYSENISLWTKTLREFLFVVGKAPKED